ncbi:MAG: DUF4384 domain-containing protein [Candidatus Eisenbacteria bacterium]|nr:DUF4384 domain-containing protein [Candidatus Eisenbacteria bacterium]
MKLRTLGLLLALAGMAPAAAGAVSVKAAAPRPAHIETAAARLVVDVWTDRGEGAVYRVGDAIRVHFRASRDCYVVIYNVDTEGRAHLLFPYRRFDPHWVEGGRDYVLPAPRSTYELTVQGPAGVEYVQALASLEPFQQLPDYLDPEYDPGDYDLDRTDWRNGGQLAGDPFVGMERINRAILPYDCDEDDCYSAAYTSYYVERKVSYPRYVCADCHGPYAAYSYDPYGMQCSVFEIRVDYDWRWRNHWPFYGAPYWYYFRRNDCPPRYFTYKPRWSSEDGWVHFRDSFGERVLWKKNPGPDPKAGNSPPRWDGRKDSPPPSALPGMGDRRRTVRTQPVKENIREVAPGSEPVRFRSRSRDLAPPDAPRVEKRRVPPDEAPPIVNRRSNPPEGQEPPRGIEGRRGEARDPARDPARQETREPRKDTEARRDPPPPRREEPAPQPRQEQAPPPPRREEPAPRPHREEAAPQPRREEAAPQPRREEAAPQPRREETAPRREAAAPESRRNDEPPRRR